jgi:hypothetical protein
MQRSPNLGARECRNLPISRSLLELTAAAGYLDRTLRAIGAGLDDQRRECSQGTACTTNVVALTRYQAISRILLDVEFEGSGGSGRRLGEKVLVTNAAG